MKPPLIWSVLSIFAPDFVQVCRAIRSRSRATKFEAQQGATQVARKIAGRSGMTVLDGPFKGMRFPETLSNRGIGSKLLGTYERELHGVIADAVAESPDTVLVVGSAEGYYAVGLGMLLPKARVEAFDIDPWARQMCGAAAALNGIAERMELGKFAGPAQLKALAGRRGLVLSDCEGYEYELFSPDVIEALRDSLVLIESHAHMGFEDAPLIARFSKTHSVQTLQFTGRHGPGPAHLAPELSAAELSLAINEFRPEIQQWIYAKPLALTSKAQ